MRVYFTADAPQGDTALRVLADAVQALREGEDTLDDARDLALHVCEELRARYGLGLTYLHVVA